MVNREQLIKYAAKAGLISRAATWLDSAPEALAGRALGRPMGALVKAPMNVANRLVRGSVNTRGPLAGTRLRPKYGPGSVRPISMERYQQVIKGDAPGMVYKVNGVPVERMTESGGLVGFAKNHPVIAGTAGLAMVSDNPLAQMLSPQGAVEYATSGFKPNLAPTAEFSQIANTPALADNVLARGADPRFARNSPKQWRYNYAQRLPEPQPTVQEPVA